MSRVTIAFFVQEIFEQLSLFANQKIHLNNLLVEYAENPINTSQTAIFETAFLSQ